MEQPGWGGGYFGNKKKMNFANYFELGEAFGKMTVDIRNDDNASKFVQMNYMGFVGGLVWVHDGTIYNYHGTLQQAITNDFWKLHGHPHAELWILRADMSGYDFVGPVTYEANEN